MRSFDVAVVGSGPVGLIAALQLARSGRSVIVLAKRYPDSADARRVDAAPAGFGALLVDLGIRPSDVGIGGLNGVRHSAWESAEPYAIASPACVHMERPALDLALLQALRGVDRVALELGAVRLTGGNPLVGSDWRAHRMVDASGRAAVTAARRTRPTRPWVARTFWAHHATHRVSGQFAIAALPDGYAYRLGASSIMTFGLVGRGAAVAGSAAAIERHVGSFAPWLLDGLPALTAMVPGPAKPASVQWSDGGPGLRIGDAALARDALSSQGIAIGASEAMLAAAVERDDHPRAIRLRQREQRQAHLRSLLGVLDRSRYADYPLWREYRAFIAGAVESEPCLDRVAIRNGRIQSLLRGREAVEA